MLLIRRASENASRQFRTQVPKHSQKRCHIYSGDGSFRSYGRPELLFPRTQRLFSTNSEDENTAKQDHIYCVDLVQQRDREGYLCGLLMPKESRRSYFAIRAWNVELASVKDSSHQQLARAELEDSPSAIMLQVRMQWWRTALAEIYGDAAESQLGVPSNMAGSYMRHPVVRSIQRAHAKHNLTRRFLDRLIDARETDLFQFHYDTLQDLELYAEETVSSLLFLSLECANVRQDDADEAAWHAGIGIGLATLLRSAPYRLEQGERPIPRELLTDEFSYRPILQWQQDLGSSLEGEKEEKTFLDKEARDAWKAAVAEIAMTATKHIARARDLQGNVPKPARSCLLPVVPAMLYLSQLQESQFDLFDQHENQKTNEARIRLRLLWWLSRSWISGIF